MKKRPSLGRNPPPLYLETFEGDLQDTLSIRPVLVGVSPGCHAHLLERHVSKTALFT